MRLFYCSVFDLLFGGLLFMSLLLGSAAVDLRAEESPKPAFQAVDLKTKLGAAKITYMAQSLGELDRPIAEEIKIADVTLRIKRLEKNELEIDFGEKRPKTIKKTTALKVAVADPENEGRTIDLTIEFQLSKDEVWTYRNKSVLALLIPGASGPLAVVDANGNGFYNDAHVDGVAWPNQRVLFPLPKPNEHWVTPELEIKDLSFGILGQDPKASLRVLSSISENGLAVLRGANDERVLLGVTPRPEDESLTTDIAKHCHWMSLNKQLSHPEKSGSPGYTVEGNAAGMRSILSSGRAAPLVAHGFVETLYHRYDVIRADLAGFGVASESAYSGIDGRSALLSDLPSAWWPILCPMPEQIAVPLMFGLEMPDPINGDTKAGFPITVVFNSNKTKLKSYSLKLIEQGVLGPDIDCYTFDAADTFVKFGNSVALIAKDPLKPASIYQVMIEAEVAGQPWSKTWVFQTR